MILHWHRPKASRGQAGPFGLVWRTASAIGGSSGGGAGTGLFGDRRRRGIAALIAGAFLLVSA